MFAVVFPYDMGVAGHIVGIINRLCHLACGSIQCHCYAGLCPENFSFLTQDISGQTTLLLLVGGEHVARPFYLAPISCMALAAAAAMPGTTEKLTSLSSIALSFFST